MAICFAQAAHAQSGMLRRQHSWGRFEPGSWKLVRVVTEALDAEGHVTTTSVARTRTTLKDVTDAGITLAVEATVEVAGKEIEAEPQTVTQGWHGESADREAVITDLGEDDLTIGGRAIACRVEQIEIAAPSGRTVTKTWYSDEVAPHVLRRETVTYDAQTGQEVSQTHVEVVALARPLRVLRRARQGAELLVVHKHAGGRTRTRVRSSLEVPGGVVEHESEEFDAAGQLTRRSKLELIDYSVK